MSLSMTANAIYLRERYRRLHAPKKKFPVEQKLALVASVVDTIRIDIPRAFAPSMAKLLYQYHNTIEDGNTVRDILDQLLKQLV